MTDKREIPISEELSKQLLEILFKTKENYSNATEFNSIKVGLASAIKGLENITLKITRGEPLDKIPSEDFGNR